MGFCSEQDIIDRLTTTGIIYSHDDDGDMSYEAADTALIEDTIAQIDEDIKVYLSPSFTTPSSLMGNVWLKSKAVDLVCERVCERKGLTAPQSIKENAERARAWLERVMGREVRVPGATYPGDGSDIERRQFGLPRAWNPGVS